MKINNKMLALEARRRDLERLLATAQEPPPLLHPKMADIYRKRIAELQTALGNDESRDEAAEIIRSLVQEIVLVPDGAGLKIDLRGDLAGILSLAAKNVGGADAAKQIGRPGSQAADLVEQVKVVAGGGFEPPTFRL